MINRPRSDLRLQLRGLRTLQVSRLRLFLFTIIPSFIPGLVPAVHLISFRPGLCVGLDFADVRVDLVTPICKVLGPLCVDREPLVGLTFLHRAQRR